MYLQFTRFYIIISLLPDVSFHLSELVNHKYLYQVSGEGGELEDIETRVSTTVQSFFNRM